MRYRHKLSTPIGAQHFLSSFNKKNYFYLYKNYHCSCLFNKKRRKGYGER